MFIEFKNHNNVLIYLNINNIVAVENWTDSKDYKCVLRTVNNGTLFPKVSYIEMIRRIKAVI